MALGQISRSERETRAMDSNLTHSPRTSYFSRSELLTSVLLFCGYKPSQTPDYSRSFTWRGASCQMQSGLLLVGPGHPVAVFCSITCVYVNDVTLHSWESTDGERQRWQRNSVFRNKNSWIFGSAAVALAPFYKGQNICRTKRLFFFPALNWRSKGRKSERSDGCCANALISFYDPVKLGLYSHLFKYYWISAR